MEFENLKTDGRRKEDLGGGLVDFGYLNIARTVGKKPTARLGR